MRNAVLFIIVSMLAFPLGSSASAAVDKRHVKKPFTSEKTTPVLYNRANIILIRKVLPPAQPMPWQNGQEAPPESDLALDVEIRDGASLYRQNDWINLSSYSDKSGIMMVFPEPAMQPIVHSPQYAPVDVLFIDKNGKVAQIAPNLSLSELDQEIYPDDPVLAFLFLKGGSCAELSINAGDIVQYHIFRQPPKILNAPKADNARTNGAKPNDVWQNDINMQTQKTNSGNN